MAGNTNVSSLINSKTNNILSKVEKVKSFGDQIPDDKKNKLKNSSLGKEADLRIQIKTITKQIIELDLKHIKDKKNIQFQQFQTSNSIYNKYFPTPPQRKPAPQPPHYDNNLSYREESKAADLEFNSGEVVFSTETGEYVEVETLYDENGNLLPVGLLQKEEKNYLNQKKLLQDQKADLQQKLDGILNDPYKRIKRQEERRQKRIRQRKQRNKNKENKEKKRLASKVLKSAAKSLAPIIALQGTRYLFSIVTTNKRIQDLIDDTNTIIGAATTKQAIENARVIRNSTIAAINENERKLLSLTNLITRLNRIISITNISLSAIILLFTIPKPFGLGPTMPTFIANRVKNLQDLVFALNIILSILQGILEAKLEDLRDLKSQLLDINNLLDNAALENLSDDDIQSFISSLQEQSSLINNSQFPEYKGFRFAIKEEETLGAQQAVVVRGNIKRRYAVAIDKDGVEVIKSEFSFTLDPQDLIEQLKLIIDQQNLQA